MGKAALGILLTVIASVLMLVVMLPVEAVGRARDLLWGTGSAEGTQPREMEMDD